MVKTLRIMVLDAVGLNNEKIQEADYEAYKVWFVNFGLILYVIRKPCSWPKAIGINIVD